MEVWAIRNQVLIKNEFYISMIMGIIYLITLPSGRCYIGKTKRRLWYRIQRHLQCARANDNKPQCRALNNALRAYNFQYKVEILVECPDEMLNYYEIKFIDMYGVIAPGGYNLTQGGEGRDGPHREESKDKMSDARRKYRNYTLPRNIVEINYDDGDRHEHGFRVILGETHTFVSSKMTMEEKYHLAIKCYETIKLGLPYEMEHKYKRHKDDEFNVPPGIVRCGDEGFAINKSGYQRATFKHVGNTRKQNLINALAHYIRYVDYETDVENYERVSYLYEELTEN